MNSGTWNTRIVFSVILVCLGLMVALVPYKENKAGQVKPSGLLEKIVEGAQYITVDQAARYIVNEDTTVRFIDLRDPEEYRTCNIPGAVNIPYHDLLNRDWEGYLHQEKMRNIFYSDGDLLSGQAWALTTRMGFQNNYILKGGINEWYEIVMQSRFKGGRITPSENARYETRRKASQLFSEMNSLPDSVKIRYLEAKRLQEAKLTGGCE